MPVEKPTCVTIQTERLHLDEGEIVPASVRFAPGEPMEIKLGRHPGADIVLPESAHVALGRVDPHVHFREGILPTREEFEADPLCRGEFAYEELRRRVDAAHRSYGILQGSLAALKGGVWLVGAMGNTPWPPVGETRWRRMNRLYREKAPILTHVWPTMAPGVEPVVGQEEKDFGSTYGNLGVSAEDRRDMYTRRRGGMVSYHNDQPRADESLEQFRDRVKPPLYLLQPLYFDGETVLACQRETLALAEEAELARLLTRHIPTGLALEMILLARETSEVELPAEIGLDYLYFNRDMLSERSARDVNYRRPALPSAQDQTALIELARERARLRDPLTFIGSDHAPHPRAAKLFREDGLPGSPGTRVIEHTPQIHINLIRHFGFTHADIDWLAAMAPARYMSQYIEFPLPVGTMQSGAMANLAIFDPETPYSANETALSKQLCDADYHTAYRGEALYGQSLFTVVNGVMYNVQGAIEAIDCA